MSKTAAQTKRNGGRIRNSVCTVLACAALLLAQSCTDVFHELIPPSDSDIHSFSVENTDRTRYCAAETDSTDITIPVPAGTDVTSLVPVIELGSKSTVIPVTLPYIHRAFPSADLMNLAVQMNASQKAGDLANWMLNFICENKDFSVPPLDEPIDFTQPVMFCVIAGRGNYRLYTVTVVPEKTEQPTEPEQPSPSEPDNPSEPDTPPVPPATECEKKILSFVVNEPKQTKPSVITEDTVAFYLNAGADSSALYPLITVSEGAGILPLTQEYLLRLFSYTELISFYSGYSSAKDTNAFISATVKKLDAAKIAKIMEADLSLPIDFSGLNSLFGVPFAVIGADKTAHVYSISCVTDEDSAALTAFAVTKIRNPGLMGDADVSVSGGTVTITATYPVEYRNFTLIPDIVIEGDTWEITGGTLRVEDTGADGAEEAEYTAGLKKAVRLVPGDAYPIGKEYTATLTVRRGEAAATYTLRLIYREDPDTIRSITDFRFLSLRNPGIKATAMASISKNEDTGFISATVLYEGGEPPYDLVADFYSPGTCTVEHIEQVSGKSKNNFQYDVQMLCTSKNKLFCRLYTVQVTFVKVKTAEAVLNYFAFPKHLNPDLSQSATGLIDESSGTVYVNAKYHTPEKPARLVPEFAATGTVSVNSILQSSGYSAQDFSRSVYYAVRDQNDWSSDTRTYRVSVNWEQDEQSACAITGFGFSMADNPSLAKDVSARINERAGTIYALLPKDAGKSDLAPYFSAQGTVTVGSAEQTSGRSKLDFSGEVIYTVTSANGLYSKQYAVSVQEAGPVIYVNAAAIGRNNGTCWQDAYITLDAAFEQAAAYGDAPKEIWIAHNGGAAYEPLSDEYRQNGLPLTANTTIRGGFAGGETDERQRQKKTRTIAFDVNAVENANEDIKIQIPIRLETDVCAVQTKLCMQDDSTGLYYSSTQENGKIVFDGIEIEKKETDNNALFYCGTSDDVYLTFSDCTVRCNQVSASQCWYGVYVSIENCDFYTRRVTGRCINASGSNFKPAPTADYIEFYTGSSTSLKTCVFQAEPKQFYVQLHHYSSITSCSFDNVGFYTNDSLSLTNCLCSYDSLPCYFRPTKIISCELKNKSGEDRINIGPTYYHSNVTITNSNIEGFNLDLNASRSGTNTEISVTHSKFLKSSFKQLTKNYNYTIKMTDVIMKETGKCLISDSRSSYAAPESITVQLTNCTFSDSPSSNSRYINLNSENSSIDIDNCSFNIHETAWVLNIGGNATITNSDFLCKSENDCATFWIAGKSVVTDSTFESNGCINLKLNWNLPHESDKGTVFTNNKLRGQYTILEARNIRELKDNKYDNFVDYYLRNPLDDDAIDLLSETIYAEPGAKKAFLVLSNSNREIIIDPKEHEEYKDFLCGLSLSNATATIKGQDFGKMPSFLNEYYQVSGTDCKLTLKDCTFDGSNQTASAVQIARYDYDNAATELIIDNCSFSNYILDNAGAVYVDAEKVEIKNNCLFTHCTNSSANYGGGAIYVSANTLKINKSTFSNNTVNNSIGGAIRYIGNKIIIEDSIFTENTTKTWRGGAVYINAKEVKLSNCTFTGNQNLETNKEKAGGGAVAIECRRDDVTTTIDSCTFDSNRSLCGNDVFMSAKWIGEHDSQFERCKLYIKNCTPNEYTNYITVSKQ